MTQLNKKDLSLFLKKIKNNKILVIGDLMLDTFEYGTITRQSPEAPVPVILISEIKSMPGGAGNVALNIKSLGGEPTLLSTIGDDAEGFILRRMLKKNKLKQNGLVLSHKRTITKKRVLVDGAHYARVDKEQTHNISKNEESKILNFINKNIGKFSVIIFSDYCKGTITKKVIDHICKLANRKNIPIILDSKPKNANLYKSKKITICTPNEEEAKNISGKDNVNNMAKYLQEYFKGSALITQGGNGMTLFYGADKFHVDALVDKSKVVDVSGCGDTVVATLSLALSAKFSQTDSVYLANYAASIVVKKPGTATVSRNEFLKNL